MNIKFEIDLSGFILTPCPYKMHDDYERINVGSQLCKYCIYHQGQDYNNNIVACSHWEENNA